MPRRRRKEQTLERVLGTPALFATAYGNVGSSIYYALGLTAVYALGLTPLVFVIAGVIFAATAATYAEGTVRYPEAGGSSSFARHAFNEVVSFGAAWSQMLVYVVTVATSAFFVPHYLSIFWAPLKQNPWDIVGGIVVIVVLVVLNTVGVQEATRVSIVLAVIDFATQIFLVILGFVLVVDPHILTSNVHWGTAPTWANLAIAIPVAMLAYTGVETVSNLAEEARDPSRSVPSAYKLVAGAVFAIYFTLPLVALSAMPVTADRRGADDEAGAAAGEGRLRERPGARDRRQPRRARDDPPRPADLRRPARGHDSVRRHQRRRDRRLADHLLDGHLPADPGDLPPPAPAFQDPVARAARLRGHRPDLRDPARKRHVRGDALLVRSHALVHRRARVDHCVAPEGRSRAPLPCPAQPPLPRRRLAAVRVARRRRDRHLVRRHPRPEPDDAVGRPRLARVGFAGYAVYRRRYVHEPMTETIKAPPLLAPALALEYRMILSPLVDSEQSREAVHLACRLAAERRSAIVAIRVIIVPVELPLDAPLPEQERLADDLLDEAHDIGELYGVRVIERVARARHAGREIVEEAARRNAEIIVMGAPRLPHRTRRSAIFGKTVDYVLKHADCRVMVGAGRRAVA